MRNALETDARRAMRAQAIGGERVRWRVRGQTNVSFTPDRSGFLTPDFLIRHGSDTVLVGEVLDGSDTIRHIEWRKARYADAGIPWYWEVELDADGPRDITCVRAYGLATVDRAGLVVEPRRPMVYVPVGEWEPDGLGIEFPEPFAMSIGWEDLAF
ncbi:hypothetical protein ACOKM5_21490 [Streptomyces sp. BH097]|uniref:hypothetical protein n=1 Tax=unclassified Streptomyces TaxID=2593676 RepID=UPI003BB708C0